MKTDERKEEDHDASARALTWYENEKPSSHGKVFIEAASSWRLQEP